MRRAAALALLAVLGLAAPLAPSCTLVRPLDGIACTPGAGDASCLHGQPCSRDADCTTTLCSGGACQCPSDMVNIDGQYCIDAHVVTNADYGVFLASPPLVSAQVPVCQWNDTFDFDTGTEGGCSTRHTEPGAPATCLSWCQAYAFCQSRDKRLCGRIGGGSLSPSAAADPGQSEWYRACSANGTLSFVTGNSFAEGLCNGGSLCQDDAGACADGGDRGQCQVDAGARFCPAPCGADAGSTKSCESPVYAGLFDMTGNVFEWEDACFPTSGQSDQDVCLYRGGDFTSQCTPEALSCKTASQGQRSGAGFSIGFRCCKG